MGYVHDNSVIECGGEILVKRIVCEYALLIALTSIIAVSF